MPKFRKKPVVIEAVRYTGDNYKELELFVGTPGVLALDNANRVWVDTLEGRMMLLPGNWLVRGIKGEFYPVDDEIFRKTYDPVEQQSGGDSDAEV